MGTELEEITGQKSITHCIETPCGKLYLTVVYKFNEINKIDYFRIEGEGGRTNHCGNSPYQVYADALTFMVRRIRNEYEAEAIIKLFTSHRCNKVIVGKPLSCADAIGKLLRRILDESR